LIGDASKRVEKLDNTYPLVLEVLPTGLHLINKWLATFMPIAKINMRMGTQKDGAVITENGNYLLDVFFAESMPIDEMNGLKMVPGVVEHSLFVGLASKAIIAGESGIKILEPGTV
jgi:ribose 5-phosphate isomerase A